MPDPPSPRVRPRLPARKRGVKRQACRRAHSGLRPCGWTVSGGNCVRVAGMPEAPAVLPQTSSQARQISPIVRRCLGMRSSASICPARSIPGPQTVQSQGCTPPVLALTLLSNHFICLTGVTTCDARQYRRAGPNDRRPKLGSRTRGGQQPAHTRGSRHGTAYPAPGESSGFHSGRTPIGQSRGAPPTGGEKENNPAKGPVRILDPPRQFPGAPAPPAC